MKLYVRDEIPVLNTRIMNLMDTLETIMKENVHTYMPGFTHLQKAQPTTLAHHFGAYYEMFRRDLSRLADLHERMNDALWALALWPEPPTRWIASTQLSCLISTVRRPTVWIPYLTAIT